MTYVLGIDIGGTNIKAALVDEQGCIQNVKSTPTQADQGREVILQNLHSLIREFINTPRLQGIGLVSAGRINSDLCVVHYATANLPGWIGLDFNREIADVYHLPIAVDNDVNAAAIGEAWQGQHEVGSSMFFLALGTGVGGGFLLDHKIVRGHTWSFAEVGHWTLYPNGILCNCGLHGCSEQYVSGTALHRRLHEATGITLNNEKDLWSEIFQMNVGVREAIESYCEDLALLLYQVQVTYDPEHIIIGGGVGEDHDKFESILFQKMRDGQERVRFATLGNKAGILGAAKLIFDKLRGGK